MRYTYAEDFFERWTPDSAYVAGLLTADGSIDRNTLSLELKSSDGELVRFVRDRLASEKPVEFTKNDAAIRFRATSRRLVDALARHGIVPSKTGKEQIPSSLPKRLFTHFLRGYFDGDGWVTLRRNTIETGICCASRDFLEELRMRCGGLGSIRSRRKKNLLLYEWNLSQSDSLTLRDIMYRTGREFGLARKRQKLFSEFYTPHKRFWTKQQEQQLTKEYGQYSLDELANRLGKSYKAVSKKIWSLNLTKSKD